MAIEIEWKFLVTKLPALPNVAPVPILQAYLSAHPAIRARLKGGKGYLTVKMQTGDAEEGKAARRYEFEYEIPIDDARQLIALSSHRTEKQRYVLANGIELDVFEGPHSGLVVAELEVESDDVEPIPPPGWEWINVSDRAEYTNQWMAHNGMPPDAVCALP
ncbi:adenylate cyclase [bacterium]|nr:adenylate cyclase [bacterium]